MTAPNYAAEVQVPEEPRVPVTTLMTEVASMVRKTLSDIRWLEDTRGKERLALLARVHHLHTTGGGFTGMGNNMQSVPAAVALFVYEEAKELAEAIASPARALEEARRQGAAYKRMSRKIAPFWVKYGHDKPDERYTPLVNKFKELNYALVGRHPFGGTWNSVTGRGIDMIYDDTFDASVDKKFAEFAGQSRVSELVTATYQAIALRDALEATQKLGVTIPVEYALIGQIPGRRNRTTWDEITSIADSINEVKTAIEYGGKAKLADAFKVVEDYNRRLQESIKVTDGTVFADAYYLQYLTDTLKTMVDPPPRSS